MLPSLHHRCVVLVLMIAISHIALAAHTVTHADTNIIQCRLCVYQGEQSHGLVPAAIQIYVITSNQQPYIMEPVIQWLHDPLRAYFQRAPPIIA